MEKIKELGCQEKDLFEDMRAIVGCEFISDLKMSSMKEKVLKALKSVRLSDYPSYSVIEFIEYARVF